MGDIYLLWSHLNISLNYSNPLALKKFSLLWRSLTYRWQRDVFFLPQWANDLERLCSWQRCIITALLVDIQQAGAWAPHALSDNKHRQEPHTTLRQWLGSSRQPARPPVRRGERTCTSCAGRSGKNKERDYCLCCNFWAKAHSCLASATETTQWLQSTHTCVSHYSRQPLL